MDDSTTLSVVLVALGAVGQTLFVVMWATLPWYREWIGRALMVKSAAMAIYLDFALVSLLLPRTAAIQWVWLGLFIVILVGIWSQVFALSYEMHRARKGRRDVMGTSR